jgi:hypothetical protein
MKIKTIIEPPRPPSTPRRTIMEPQRTPRKNKESNHESRNLRSNHDPRITNHGIQEPPRHLESALNADSVEFEKIIKHI